MIERSKIEGWLEEVGVPVTDVEVEGDAEGIEWHLGFKGGPFLTVAASHATEWPHLQLQVGVGVSKDHQALLESLDGDTVDRFMFDLRIALLQQQVMYIFESEPDGRLTRMTFTLNAYEEDLTKAGFLRRNHRLQNAALLAVQMVKKLARFKEWS